MAGCSLTLLPSGAPVPHHHGPAPRPLSSIFTPHPALPPDWLGPATGRALERRRGSNGAHRCSRVTLRLPAMFGGNVTPRVFDAFLQKKKLLVPQGCRAEEEELLRRWGVEEEDEKVSRKTGEEKKRRAESDEEE